MGCLKIPYLNNLEVNKNYFKKELTSKNSSQKDYNYLLFGSTMPGRSFSSGDYRFGFNGMEQSDIAEGNYTTPFREIDTRLGGRWWSPDPVVKPWESPYAGFANNPIVFSDPSGLDPKEGDDEMVDKDGNPIVVSVEAVEVIRYKADKPTTVDTKSSTSSGRQATSEKEQDDYYGSMKSYRKDFNFPNDWSDDYIRDFWDANYGGTGKWDEELAKISQEAKDYNLAMKLSLFTSYFWMLEDVSMVYMPATALESVIASRLAHGGKLFTYVPRGNSFVKLSSNASDNILTLTESTKFKTSFNVEGSASELYARLNSKWDGTLFKVSDDFSRTSFNFNGGKVHLQTNSKSTAKASVKVVEKGGHSLFFRFTKF